jgi:hypothetical protein
LQTPDEPPEGVASVLMDQDKDGIIDASLEGCPNLVQRSMVISMELSTLIFVSAMAACCVMPLLLVMVMILPQRVLCWEDP